MADAARSLRYRAFIAASRSNTAAAVQVFRRLQRFDLGRRLAGRQTALGTVPRRLTPIFLDQSEFDAGTSLSAQTVEALDRSAALIVLASPDAAQSWPVNEEVRLFRHRHPGRRIIPAIVAGPPGAGTDMLFPPALRFALDAEGAVTRVADEVPLGADQRRDGDDRAFAKIVAGLTGLHIDEVHQRGGRRRRHLAATWAAVAVLALALGGTGSFFYIRANQQRQMLGEIEALVRQYQPVAAAQAAVPGGMHDLTAALTAIVQGAATDPRYAQALALLKAGKPGEAEPLLRSAAEAMAARNQRVASQAAEAFRNLGAVAGLADPTRARAAYARAVALDPDNFDGLFWSGRLELNAGNLDAAEHANQRLLALAQTGQSNTERHYAFWARLGLGDIAAQRSRYDTALVAYRTVASAIQSLAATAPDNTDWQRDLSVTYEKVGGVQVAQGNLADALQSYRADLAITERLAKADSNNTHWQRDLKTSYDQIGNVLVALGNPAEALQPYRASLAIAKGLANADPNNGDRQRDLSVSYETVGNVLVAQGNLAEALQSYRAGVTIAERLAKADPNNIHWQRDLTTSYDRIGNVLVAQGNPAEALQAYRSRLAIAEGLANADPNNADRQRNLSVSYETVGDVLVAQGNLAEALQSYRAGLVIADRLAKTDPSNTDWQRDLSVLYEKVGNVLAVQGNLPDALQSYRAGLTIAERLAKADPNNAGWQRDLLTSLSNVAETLLKLDNRADALPLTEHALAQFLAAITRMPNDPGLSGRLPYYEDLLHRASAPSGPVPGSEEDLVDNAGNRVFFDPGQSNLKPDARATLDRQVAWLSRYDQVKVLIAGNTDEKESGTPAAERSRALGVRRANSVRDYLLAKGIAASRIATISYGKDRPAAAGATEQARAQNRTAITSVR